MASKIVLLFVSLLIVVIVSSSTVNSNDSGDEQEIIHQIKTCVKIALQKNFDMKSSEVNQFVGLYLNADVDDSASFEGSRKRRTTMKELQKWAIDQKKKLEKGKNKRQAPDRELTFEEAEFIQNMSYTAKLACMDLLFAFYGSEAEAAPLPKHM